jgi:serine/threonine protein kinase
MVDRTVLQYQLIEKLGAGGMGEVYKARDTRLNRFVAMKVLPAGMSTDPERRRRFVQEAQAASALNHPNIITIYDIVSDGDTQYMVMEYLAGKTLLELIPKDGLRVPQVIEYTVQMAEALSAAHAAGIIHRDLKPANVMVTGSGLVKLLDFGLAKLIDRPAVGDTAETATRIEAPLTVQGTMMGTVNYMSPEQAEGRKLDARSDIFSFGAVLYEMLTGRCAFRGSSVISTLSAVLRDDIQPIAEQTPDVPFGLDRIVVQCLRKDPEQRFQSMLEVNRALAALKRQADSGLPYDVPTMMTPITMITPGGVMPPPSAGPRASKALALGAAVLVAALASVGGYWWMTRHGSTPPPPQTQPHTSVVATPPSDGTLTNGSILEMTEAKVAPSVILSQIRASKTNFNLSAAEVIRLSKAGVPAAVIEGMRNPNGEPVSTIPATVAPVAKAPEVVTATSSVVLGDALPIRLTLAEDIPSDAAEGDTVRFTVAHEVRVEDTVVIPKGAGASGAIVDGAKKKILGIGGKMTFRLEKADAVDGQQVTIRATQARRDDGPSKRPFNTSARKSKEVAAAAGAEYLGYVDGTNTVVVKK